MFAGQLALIASLAQRAKSCPLVVQTSVKLASTTYQLKFPRKDRYIIRGRLRNSSQRCHR
jgi:hypothetical protein